MYSNEIERQVTQVVAEVSEKKEEEIWEKREQNLFKDLGLDSLLALEIVAMLENKYNISVPEERIIEISTLNDAIHLVEDMLAAKDKAAAQ